MAIHDQLLRACHDRPLTTSALVLATLAVSIFLVIRQIFLPVGLRKREDGSRYRLPRGPTGIPIFGSLPQLARERHDVEYKWVSKRWR